MDIDVINIDDQHTVTSSTITGTDLLIDCDIIRLTPEEKEHEVDEAMKAFKYHIDFEQTQPRIHLLDLVILVLVLIMIYVLAPAVSLLVRIL